jgi:hypothetical protein
MLRACRPPNRPNRAHVLAAESQWAEAERALGPVSSLVDPPLWNSALCASLTHRASDFTQTLLAVPPETNGVLSHQ